jgi:hypothetical protein
MWFIFNQYLNIINKIGCKVIALVVENKANLFANVKLYGIAVPDVKGNTQVSIGEIVVKLKHNKRMKKT